MFHTDFRNDFLEEGRLCWVLKDEWVFPRKVKRKKYTAGRESMYPLQYSDLENSMNCVVHGVAKSRTWLSDQVNNHPILDFLNDNIDHCLPNVGIFRTV